MIEFSVRRPVAVLMICIGLTVLGIIAAKRIPVQLLPNIQTPEFTVVTSIKGATPEEVENLVTAPIERAVSTVSGLEKTTSNSERERSEVRLNFKSNINYLETVSALRERLDSAGLPEGTTRPKILRFQANAAPVIRLAIKPRDAGASPLETSQLLQEVLIKRLEGVEGVATASLLGAPQRKIQITVDPIAAFSFGISLSNIPELIQSHNRSYPAGDIEFEGKRTSIKLGQGIGSIDDLKNLIVKKDGQKIIHLRDVALIKEIIEKPSVRTHMAGEDSFVIEVRKEAEANTVKVAEDTKKVIAAFLEENTNRVQGWILFDQGHQIELAIDNVGESVFHGGILAGIVIFILIQNWWPTFVVSVSMPISILITFILMYFTGISFNLMSLAGLALGVGMLVDNSTVVLDNIHLYQSRVNDSKLAALWGAKTVVGAITGSTLSTIAVFGPLAFVDGMIGQMFRDVAATVCYSLAASLFSAVFIIPMLSAVKISPSENNSEISKKPQWLKLVTQRSFFSGSLPSLLFDVFKKNIFLTKLTFRWIAFEVFGFLKMPLGFCLRLVQAAWGATVQPFLNRVSRWILWLEVTLRRVIPAVIGHSGPTLRWAVGATVLGLAFLAWRGAELFPDESADRLVYDLEFAPGQSVEMTESRVTSLENKLAHVPGVMMLSSAIGENGSHQARITFQVDEKMSLSLNQSLSTRLAQEPGLTFNRSKEALVGEGKTMQIEIYNEDLVGLKDQTLRVKESLARLDTLVDLESNIKSDLSEIVIQFSRDRLGWFGVEASSFVGALRPMLMGQSAGILQVKGEELPVQVRLPASYFDSVEKVKYLSLPQDEDKPLYLSQVSDIREQKVLASIKRINRKRMSLISANLHGSDLDSVSKKIKIQLENEFGKEGLVWKMGGQNEERERSQKSLMIAVGLSIFLIYLMLAAQFENLMQPVIILCAVPLCISGVALFLLLFNLNVSALVFVGFIILVGVSVNTSIVMVDFANQMVAEGKSLEEAISEATVRRLRPILVTTLSGILGLVPMALAIGQGSAMQQPLAVTMIGGHLSSTILTVLVVPIVYARLAKRAQLEKAG